MNPRARASARIGVRPRVLDPEHRIRGLILRAELDPQASDPDPDVDLLLQALNGRTTLTEDLAEALRLWLDDFKRARVAAWLFAGAEDEVIERYLSIRRGVTALFRRFFFDTTVFVDRLDRELYADLARERLERKEDPWYHRLLLEAHRYGLASLVAVYAETLDPSAVSARVARDLFLEYMSLDGPPNGEDAVARRDVARMLLGALKGLAPPPDSGATAREQVAIALRDEAEAARLEIEMKKPTQTLDIIH